MTYKEILNSHADKTVNTYKSYLEAKIAALSDADEFLAAKTEQYRSEYERLEKKLIAMLAIIKNDDSLDQEAPEGFEDEFAG